MVDINTDNQFNFLIRQLKNIFTGEERQESQELLNKIQRLFLSQQERIQKLEIQVHTMDHKYELRFQKIEKDVRELQDQQKQQKQNSMIQDVMILRQFQQDIKEKKISLFFSGQKKFQQCKGDDSQSLENIEEQLENITINNNQQKYQLQEDNELGALNRPLQNLVINNSKNQDTKFDID